MAKKEFLTGAETVVKAALNVGAEYFFGYPITPGTEVLSLWGREADKNKKLGFLQTEDEIAAGFAMNGAVLAGCAAFTATAGPGTILMQDALVMAEAMRLPVVLIIIQRGGPSSGTVIYSQQEVNLAIWGGNNEGMRLVYSPSNLDELYSCAQKVFINAWKYRFPSIVLTDGYLMKTRGVVARTGEVQATPQNAGNQLNNMPIVPLGSNTHIPNIYTFEEDLNKKILSDAKDFEAMAQAVLEFESEPGEVLIVAHGIVGAAVKQAVGELREQGVRAGFFRPITLNPFPKEAFNEAAKKAKKILVVESSLGQFERIIKNNLEVSVPVEHYLKPALGIEVREIVDYVK